MLEALNAGAIDLGGVGNTPPLFAAAAKSNLEVVSGATMGAKGDTIVVPKETSPPSPGPSTSSASRAS
jgi:sulfonate transport system substrate-binding protein